MSVSQEPNTAQGAAVGPRSPSRVRTWLGVAGASRPSAGPDGDRLWPRGGRVPGLDGLRAISVLAVLAYHAGFGWASGGFLGVSQFFTLSGFLITSLLLGEHRRTGTISMRSFWARRFRRLLPGASLGLLLATAFALVAGSAEQLDALPRQVAAAALYVANWEFLRSSTSYVSIFQDPSPVQHYWSLSIEEQFYVLVPLGLVALLRATRSRVVLGGVLGAALVASAGWAVHLFDGGDGFERVYFGTDTRLPELLGGALLAVVVGRLPSSRRARQLLGALGLVALLGTVAAMSLATLRSDVLWQGGTIAFTAATAVVVVGVLGDGVALRGLSWRPLVGLGRISYGVYLFHWPIFLWLTEERTGLSSPPLFLVRLVVTVAVATLSFLVVEEPIRRGARLGLPAMARWLSIPAAVAAVVAVALLAAAVGPEPADRTFGAEDVQAAPSVGDPVLDVLVVTGPAGEPVADELERRAASDPNLVVTRAATLRCPALVERDGKPACAETATWPALVDEADPDVVLVLDADLSPARLGALDPAAEPRPLARALVESNLEVLAARGAPVVWVGFTPSVADAIRAERDPFLLALGSVASSDPRLRPYRELDYTEDPGDEAFVSRSAEQLEDVLRQRRRRPGGDGGRVMVVGDSQAQSMAYGVQRWSNEVGGPLVWTAAVGGCGLVTGGQVIRVDSGQFTDEAAKCADLVDRWAQGAADFGADRVVVWSSLRDLQPRRLPSWSEVKSIGDPVFDRYVLDTYVDAFDRFAETGAEVVWIVPPCIDDTLGFGYRGEGSPFEPDAIERLRDDVVAELARRRPDVVLLDLQPALCPEGSTGHSVEGVGILRPDGLHLTADASTWLAAQIGPEVTGTDG